MTVQEAVIPADAAAVVRVGTFERAVIAADRPAAGRCARTFEIAAVALTGDDALFCSATVAVAPIAVVTPATQENACGEECRKEGLWPVALSRTEEHGGALPPFRDSGRLLLVALV